MASGLSFPSPEDAPGMRVMVPGKVEGEVCYVFVRDAKYHIDQKVLAFTRLEGEAGLLQCWMPPEIFKDSFED